MLPLPPLQLSAGGGGPSTASASNGINTATSNPFNFDHSGWVVNLNSNGASLNASGGSDANATSQTPSGATGGGALGGMNPMLIMAAVGLYILLR